MQEVDWDAATKLANRHDRRMKRTSESAVGTRHILHLGQMFQ